MSANHEKKVVVFGAGGRVGLQLTATLLSHQFSVVAVDVIGHNDLQARINRVSIDAKLTGSAAIGSCRIVAGFNVLDQHAIEQLLRAEQPDLVVNYAIPFTWDATKSLPNYSAISAAGLGAFAPIQALAPFNISQAMAATQSSATLVVGNLPDVTIPILYGLSHHFDMVLPVAGAGNVGLIESGVRHTILSESDYDEQHLQISLVCHHVHWVAPREPGYPNDAPYYLQVMYQGRDITHEFGDTRQLINRAISSCYEPGAGFSSTTGILAARLVMALLDSSGREQRMHVPAPNGMNGGYPVKVANGEIQLAIPEEWDIDELNHAMQKTHQGDGITSISEDGVITFAEATIRILKQELGIELPERLTPENFASFALKQIEIAQSR